MFGASVVLTGDLSSQLETIKQDINNIDRIFLIYETFTSWVLRFLQIYYEIEKCQYVSKLDHNCRELNIHPAQVGDQSARSVSTVGTAGGRGPVGSDLPRLKNQ